MANEKYIIAEFNDGLQLIPAAWFNADTSLSICPSHLKTKLRINKAIMGREMPREKADWEELRVKKVFGVACTYEEGLQKISLAEYTSNIDEEGISSDELREREKQKRRKKAKKHVSSSSSEDLCSFKENCATQEKILPAFPQKQNFVSYDTELLITSTQGARNILCENTLFNTISINDITDTSEIAKNSNVPVIKAATSHVENENLYIQEFKKLILGKLNKILYKLHAIENKCEIFQEKIQHFNQSNVMQNNDIHFPISTLAQLTLVEEQLQDMTFKEHMLATFQLVGGNNVHVMIRNIFKQAITDNLATQFSWTGKKTKRCFKDLRLSKVIAS